MTAVLLASEAAVVALGDLLSHDTGVLLGTPTEPGLIGHQAYRELVALHASARGDGAAELRDRVVAGLEAAGMPATASELASHVMGAVLA